MAKPKIGAQKTDEYYTYRFGLSSYPHFWQDTGVDGWGVAARSDIKLPKKIPPFKTMIDGYPVTHADGLFANNKEVKSIDVSALDMSNIVSMKGMFKCCTLLENITGLDCWSTGKVTDMSYMFGYNCIKSLDLNGLDTSSVTDMTGMFSGCKYAKSIDISRLNTSKVENMSFMFDGCNSLTSLKLGNIDTSKVKSMAAMFKNCIELIELDVGNFNTSNVENMLAMFISCKKLVRLNVDSFDVSNVKNMSLMFADCNHLQSMKLNNFNSSNVENMRSMFKGCSGLSSIEFGNFKTSQVIDMGEMFSGCNSLTSLDLSGFDTSNVNDMYPGRCADCIDIMNDSVYEGLVPLDKYMSEPDASPFYGILNQLLMYSEFEDLKLGSYQGELLNVIYELIDIIDEFKYERNPKLRVQGVNRLLCRLQPYLREVIDNILANQPQNMPQLQGSQGQQSSQSGQNSQGGQAGQGGQGGSQGTAGAQNGNSGQNGQPDQSGQQGGQSGKGSKGGKKGSKAQNGIGNGAPQMQNIPKDVADAILEAITRVANESGATARNENCQSSAINNPDSSDNKNNNANSSQDGSGDSNGAAGGGTGPGSLTGTPNLNPAVKELESLVNQITTGQAMEQAEKERTADLNREAHDMVGYGGDSLSITVTRAASVSDENRRWYEEAAKKVLPISRALQRGIKDVIKARRNGGIRRNLPFGPGLDVQSVIHNDGKYFRRRIAPTETPRLGVGLLVDQSGSTGGELIKASTMASLVVEDFCRELKIPHIICGYTTGGGSAAHIFSYAEPNEIDKGNRYRITGMQSTGGTPTAEALQYMVNRVSKLPADIKLLIVISDGGSADNYVLSNGKHIIDCIVAKALKNHIAVFAAGIGSERESVEAEFKDNFLDISDLDMMPVTLIKLIKANLWV